MNQSFSLDSPLRLGRCESLSKLWYGPNKQTLVLLKMWVLVHLQVNPDTIRLQWEMQMDYLVMQNLLSICVTTATLCSLLLSAGVGCWLTKTQPTVQLGHRDAFYQISHI